MNERCRLPEEEEREDRKIDTMLNHLLSPHAKSAQVVLCSVLTVTPSLVQQTLPEAR